MAQKMVIPQIKRILYATDLSKNSAYAFYYATDLAQKRNAQIVILHAVEPINPSVSLYMTEQIVKVREENLKEAAREIERRLQNFCAKVDSKVGGSSKELVSKILVRLGYPVEEILKTADEEKCDLIVLGNHGKGFLQQTFLGSVSRSVLDRSRKPVLIIPLPPEEVEIGWDEPL